MGIELNVPSVGIVAAVNDSSKGSMGKKKDCGNANDAGAAAGLAKVCCC